LPVVVAIRERIANSPIEKTSIRVFPAQQPHKIKYSTALRQLSVKGNARERFFPSEGIEPQNGRKSNTLSRQTNSDLGRSILSSSAAAAFMPLCFFAFIQIGPQIHVFRLLFQPTVRI
jgi:hypothetical protein